MKKKLLALLLTLCLVLGLFPIGVSAIETPNGEYEGSLQHVEYHVTQQALADILKEYEADLDDFEKVCLNYTLDGKETTRKLIWNPIPKCYWRSFPKKVSPQNIISLTIELDDDVITIDNNHLSAALYTDAATATPFYELTYYKPQYTLTYNANGGKVNPETVQVTEGDTVALNVTPTYEGNLFVGWTKDTTVVDRIFDRTATGVPKPISEIENVTAPQIVYAIWATDENGNETPDYQETKYTVTYTDGVESEKIFEDQVTCDLLKGEQTPAFEEEEALTRDGYVFGGWDPEVAETVTDDVTYKALWDVDSNGDGIADKDQVFIKYEAGENGMLTGDETTHSQVFVATEDGKYELIFPGLEVNTGYTFDRWSLPEGLSMTDNLELTGAKAGETYTLTALFKKDDTQTKELSCTINYYVDGKLKETATKTETVWVGDPDKLTVTDEVIKDFEGCIFNFASPRLPADVPNNGLIEVYYNSDSNKDGIADMNQIHVTFVIDEGMGTCAGDTDWWWTCKDTSAETFPLNTPVVTAKEGFEFIGWACNDGAAVTEDNGTYYLTQYTLGRAYTLTARFEKTEPAEVAMKIRFMDGETFVSGGDYFLPEGVQNYSILEEYVPEGYKMSVSGDFMVAAGTSLDVPVEKLVENAIVNIRFMDGDEFIAGGDFFFEKDASVKFGDLALPEGYELDSEKNNAESGFVARDGAQIIVHVKKISTTGIMNIRFMDGETFVAGGDYFLPLGVQNYSVLTKYVPEGYRMCVAGDFMVTDGGKLDVPVEKIPTTGIMNIRFMDGDEFVAGGDYFLPLGVQNYSVLTKYVPEGYRMCVAGDFMVTDGGKLDVPVEKIPTTGIMNIRFVEESTDKFIAGGDYMLPLGVQNYSILAQYVPEGYRMCVAGDFMVTDGGKLNVPVEKIEEETYTVTLVGEGKKAYGEGTYEAGETVTIYAGTKTGYSFDRWVTRDVTLRDADERQVSFVMPEHDVTVKATWDYDDHGSSSSKTYPIYIEETRDGEVESSHKRAAAGTTITLTVEPEDGSELVKLTVVDEDGDKINVRYHAKTGDYTFTMPASEVTVKAVFDSDLPFKDVSVDSWYYDAVSYVYRNGLMNGISATRFAPNAKLNRAMIAQVLYNLEGETRSYPTVFSDVADSAWYADAVNWAADKGIVEGYGNGKFGPEDNITREQMAAILYRYADYKGYDVRASARLSGFADEDQVSDWAEEAMSWAVAEDLMDGKGNNRLDPTGTATRAEVATILMRFCETIVEA